MEFVNKITIDGILAGIATLSAPIVALWIAERVIRKRNRLDDARDLLISKLVAHRGDTGSSEFLEAFNSISLYFGKNKEVRDLISDFRKAADRNLPRDEILTKLLHKLCHLQGYKHITEEDIFNLFQPLPKQ